MSKISSFIAGYATGHLISKVTDKKPDISKSPSIVRGMKKLDEMRNAKVDEKVIKK